MAAMRTIRIILLLAIACTVLPCSDSKAFWGKKTEPTVRLSTEGRVYVGKRYTGLAKLGSELKAKGIKPDTRIVVEIPHNTSPDALAAIAKELMRNGYRRYVFNKPRKAVAEKGYDPLIKHLEKKPKK